MALGGSAVPTNMPRNSTIRHELIPNIETNHVNEASGTVRLGIGSYASDITYNDSFSSTGRGP